MDDSFSDQANLTFVNQTWWHRFVRRMSATPVLFITLDNRYTLSWQWDGGVIEIEKTGSFRPGETIEVPSDWPRHTKVVIEKP